MKSMVAFSRNVVDDGVAGGFHLVQQIGDETQMFPGMTILISFMGCSVRPFISYAPFLCSGIAIHPSFGV